MQKQGSDKLEEMLKAQLGNAERAVPESLWTALEEELFPEKKRRFFIWWWFLLAELVAIAVIVPFKAGVSPGDNVQSAYVGSHASEKTAASWTAKDKAMSKPGNDSRAAGTGNSIAERTNHPASSVERKIKTNSHTAGSGHSTISKSPKKHNVTAQVSHEKSGKSAKRRSSGNLATVATNQSGTHRSDLSFVSTETGGKQTPENREVDKQIFDSTALPDQIDTLPRRNIDAAAGPLVSRNELPNPPKDKQPGSWKIGLNGGYDFFSQAVFADYLKTGQLSHDSYRSSGYELSLNVSRKVLPWLSVELFGAFNRKKSGYVYDILVDRNTYFSNVLTGESLDLSQISASDPANCFYLRNATASYTLDSWLGGLNIDLETKLRNRLGLYGGIGGLGNISTAMKNLTAEKLLLQSPEKERFSYLQLQASCGLSWKFSDYLSWRLGATYRAQVTNRSEFLSGQHSILVNTGITVFLKSRK